MEPSDFNAWMALSKQIALIIFFSVFVGIVAWAYWPGNRKRFEKMGRTMLDEDDEERPPPT